MRIDLPTGTVTFLFTDVEGSTKLLHELGAEAYANALLEHRRIIRAACAAEGGVEVDTQGDAFFFAFRSAPGAVAAAFAFTETLASGPIEVRVGLHTGLPLQTAEGYVGEDVHFAARVAASSHGGQVVLSKTTAGLVQAELTDLGEHRLKDVAEPVAIYQLGRGSFPPLKTISNTNLPRPASSFLGREAELKSVLERIEAGARLLTLTGPGGSGKTRLALEAAASLVPEYKAGVFWVGLAPLRDPALVQETISQTLGAKDGLADHIGDREMLLLLDNLEQVVEAAPDLASLLEACPNLALLATSRELLRVRGEVEYPVPPLASPEAVALFCERSGLEPSEEIAELCARLDNLPLAVELAAARTKALTPAQILQRLSQRLDLLKGGRDADPRQQTLRATIEWSYDLLSPDEQRLFAALSVFAGGSTVEAAEEVADADLDTLQSLVEKSLLRFTNERYWMLETIREYAGERLADRPDDESMRRGHALLYCGLAIELSALEQPGELVARLTEERENMRVALELALERDDVALAADLVHGVWRYWLMTGSTEEARSCARRYLRADRMQVPPLRRIHGDHGAGEILRFTGDNEGAATLKYELIEVARANPNAVLHGRSTEQVLAANLGDLTHIELERGRLTDAQALADDALAVRRRIGGPVAHALHALAAIAYDAGDYERVRALMTEAKEEFDTAGNPLLMLACWVDVAECDLLLGNDDSAADTLRELLDALPAVPDQNLELNVLRLAAMVSTARGHTQRAAALFGAADAKLEQLDLALFGSVAEMIYQSYVERARAELGAAGFEVAYAEGTRRRDEDVPGLVSPVLN